MNTNDVLKHVSKEVLSRIVNEELKKLIHEIVEEDDFYEEIKQEVTNYTVKFIKEMYESGELQVLLKKEIPAMINTYFDGELSDDVLNAIDKLTVKALNKVL